ncbi:DUF1428 domain-containing protein [Cereibacter sp. SYSU M97828]|nr:DUF1428 domain-containing protein [Cereibacter flavus]
MYVDGFVIPVPTERIEDYRKMAELGATVWMEHGALSYVEACADDVPQGEVTSFPMAVKLEQGEVVFFSWITYRDRAHRDEVNRKVMEDPRMNCEPATAPFEAKRMIYGGFTAMVQH